MEENVIIGVSLVPFFSDKSGRNFAILTKKEGKTEFIGGLMGCEGNKKESTAKAIMRTGKKDASMILIPHADEAAYIEKTPIQESVQMLLSLDDKDEEIVLSYLSSYCNTVKEAFTPNDKKIADWIFAHVFVAEVDFDLDKETLREWFRAGIGVDDLVIVEIENEKPELSDNYQAEIYNDALDYLRRWLNVSYGLIP